MQMTWLRRIAIVLGVLVALVIVAAAVLVATFDANRYKGLAIDWMKTERQRTLAIDGPIELSLFPRLAIQVSKVRLSEHGRADEFLAIDEAALAVAVLPLLRKQVVVDRVSARGVRAAYLRDAKGARNIDDLVGGSAAPAPAAPSPPAAGGATVRFDVSAVKLENVQLRVRDALAKIDGDVVLQSFSSGRLANRAESPVSLRASVQLKQPQALKLALDGGTTLALDLDRNAVALRDMKLDVTLDGAGVKDLTLAATGAIGWDGAAVRAGPLKLALKSASFGGTALAASSLDVKQLLFNTGAQRLELDSLKVAASGRQGADMPFELALDWPQLAVDAQSLKGSALSGQVKTSGPIALTGSFRSGAPSGKFEALRLPGLVLTVQGQMQQRKVDGTLKADLVLNASRGAATLDPLDLKTTLSDPGLQPLQLAVRGKGNADAKAAAWTLDGALNTNRFESAGQAAFAGAVPTIKAHARFDSLDLNKLLAPDKPGAPAPAPAGPAPADTPVALDGLNAVNGQFNVSAGALAFQQYRASDVKVDAALDNGLLRITKLAGRAWGGTIDGSGSAQAKGHRIAVKLAADGVDVNALLKTVAGKDLLEGTGRVTADVNTVGATVGALRSALAGTVALQIRDGAVKGVNLARSLRQAKAAMSGKQDAVSKANTAEKTDFSELTASARIANGVAQSDDLDVKSPFLRIGGSGRFDIGRGVVDYTARATVVETSKGQEGADLAALKGLTVPVRLTGPFEAIDWQVQWSAVAAAVIESRMRGKLAEQIGIKPTPRPAGAAAGTAGPAASAPPRSDKDKLRDQFKRLLK
ncbi:MAG TPA: AsmA family protein [Burkholderiaceae bacterium]|nr:AsmA family protein [Burkholderiaceae bacterium]